MILQNYGKSMQQFGFYSSLAQRLNICIRTKNRENLQKDINISSRGVYPPFHYKMFMINTNTFPPIFWIQKVINISSGVVYPPIHHKVFMINNKTFPPIFWSCRLHVGPIYTTPYECIASMSKITSPNKLIITYKSISLPSKLKLKIINFSPVFWLNDLFIFWA